MNEKSEIIIYQTDDGLTKIDVRLDEDTVWLTQSEMAELFQKNVSTISRHIQNVFEEGELQKNESNLRFLQIASSDKPIALYSLDVTISVGYRVKSMRGTQFRIWANRVLKEYITKGFALDDDRLKEGGGRYFKELLQRVRDIRTSERNLYQQVTDIYAHPSITIPKLKLPGNSLPPYRTRCIMQYIRTRPLKSYSSALMQKNRT